MPNKSGRPTKLNPQRQKDILRLIRAGCLPQHVAPAVGLSRQTLHNWLQRGENEPSGPFCDFADAVALALAQVEARCLKLIRDAAKADWRAAAWWLERAFPDQWAAPPFHPQKTTESLTDGPMPPRSPLFPISPRFRPKTHRRTSPEFNPPSAFYCD